MRSAILASLLAGALAVPHVKRQDVVVTDVEVVYATVVVTVTAGAEPTSATVNAAAAPSSVGGHWGHSWGHSYSSAPAPVESSAAPVPVSSAEPSPASVAPSTYVAPAPAPSSEASAPSAASSADSSVPTTYNEIVVYHHNIHRANHSSPDLEWDDSLASTAQTIAQSCVYAHNTAVDGGGYGQNIAAGIQPDNISYIITDLMYNGEVGWYSDYYGWAQPNMTDFDKWGHFSQIVWKDTTHVGCATYDCSSTGLANVGSDVPPYFTVCNYKSPGNYAGEYGDNIGSPLKHAIAQWFTGLGLSI